MDFLKRKFKHTLRRLGIIPKPKIIITFNGNGKARRKK